MYSANPMPVEAALQWLELNGYRPNGLTVTGNRCFVKEAAFGKLHLILRADGKIFLEHVPYLLNPDYQRIIDSMDGDTSCV